jgi:hypothetical protein
MSTNGKDHVQKDRCDSGSEEGQTQFPYSDTKKLYMALAPGMAVGLALSILFHTDPMQDIREITTQELIKDFLVKGLVDKIEIVNSGGSCLVHVHGGPCDNECSADSGQKIFSMQLVDGKKNTIRKLEDKVESVQRQLGKTPLEFVPLHFSQSSDLGAPMRVATMTLFCVVAAIML